MNIEQKPAENRNSSVFSVSASTNRDISNTASNTSDWPALRYESITWNETTESSASRKNKLSARGPYQAAIPAFIADAHPLIRNELLAEVEDATTALAKFDFEIGTFTAPFDAILLRSESASSSEVENLTASAKQLALAELGEKNSSNARIVVDNVSAMRAALELSKEPSASSIIEMHRALLGRTRPEICGSWRDRPVWIGGFSPHSADFVGPESSRIPELIADLEIFMKRADLPILVQVAISHAQFETIHPFEDGNGRTGRALVQSLLRHTELTTNTAIPVSAGLLHDTEKYFDALNAYRDGEIEPIIEAFTEAVFRAISNGRQLVQDLQNIADAWSGAHSFRRNSGAARILSLLIAQPVVSINLLTERLGLSSTAVSNSIDQLVETGVLRPLNPKKRNRMWVSDEVLEALDAFAARSRRR